MRLICPNCNAQYEVDDNVIPSGGRDVQCSGCGHTWFQMPAAQSGEDQSASPADSDTAPPPDEPEIPADTPAAGEITEIAAEMPDDALYEEITEEIEEEVVIGFISPDSSLPPEQTADDADLPPDETGNDTPAAHRPRPVDESVLNILREEARAEIDMRKREGTSLETQTDMDLGAPAGGMVPPRKQEADPDGPETAHDSSSGAAEDTGGQPGTRRDLLPDIEEINSTLQADTTTGEEDEEDSEREAQIAREARIRHRRGARLGFSLMLALLALVLLCYVYADTLAQRFPGSAPAIAAYVDRINDLRFWLDGIVERATIFVDGAGPGG